MSGHNWNSTTTFSFYLINWFFTDQSLPVGNKWTCK